MWRFGNVFVMCDSTVDCTGCCQQQPEALESEVLGWWPRWYLDSEARLDGCGMLPSHLKHGVQMSSDYVHMIHAQYYKVAIENLHIGLRTGPAVIAFRGIIEEVQKGITPKPGTGWTNNCNRLGRRGVSLCLSCTRTLPLQVSCFSANKLSSSHFLMCCIVAFQILFRDIHLQYIYTRRQWCTGKSGTEGGGYPRQLGGLPRSFAR